MKARLPAYLEKRACNLVHVACFLRVLGDALVTFEIQEGLARAHCICKRSALALSSRVQTHHTVRIQQKTQKTLISQYTGTVNELPLLSAY